MLLFAAAETIVGRDAKFCVSTIGAIVSFTNIVPVICQMNQEIIFCNDDVCGVLTIVGRDAKFCVSTVGATVALTNIPACAFLRQPAYFMPAKKDAGGIPGL